MATIIEMVTHTRLDCIAGSAASMRRGVAEAVHHARHRRAFGARLAEQPLMVNVLADLALESEAATAAALRLARAYDEDDRPLRRFGTAVLKYWVCKRATAHVAEALECLGGNGYVEESPMPQLLRDAPINGIWEGAGNVMSLDVLRALAREPDGLPAFLAECELARGADARLDAALDALPGAVAELDGPEGAWSARRAVEALALAFQASLLVRHAPPFVADAFCAGRLGEGGGRAYGTLPRGRRRRGDRRAGAGRLTRRAGADPPGGARRLRADEPAATCSARARRTWRSPPWPSTTGSSSPARSSSACPASRATVTTSRPTPSPAARWRSSWRGRSGSACPRCWSTDVRAAMARRGGPLLTATRPPRCPSSGSRARAARRRRRGSSGRCWRRRVGRAGCSARSRRSSAGRAAPIARTTPEAIELQATFRAMLDGGDRACAMEVSSHALDLHRVDGMHFAVAAFTNLSQDHLDFHPDMEAYFAAKRRLFEEFDVGTAVVCVDDDVGRAARRRAARRRHRGRRRGRGLARARRPPRAGRHGVPRRLARPARRRSSCRCAGASTPPTRSWRSPAGMRSASSWTGWRRALATAPAGARPRPAGRGGPAVRRARRLLAQAGRARERAATARDMAAGRVIVVFGAGGDRDRGKRPLMGEIAARLADVAVVTSDNPRSEDPEAIIDEILAGVPAGAAGVERIADRRAAIARAVGWRGPATWSSSPARATSAGRSSRGGRKEPFDDVAVAREALRSPGAAGSSPAASSPPAALRTTA